MRFPRAGAHRLSPRFPRTGFAGASFGFCRAITANFSLNAASSSSAPSSLAISTNLSCCDRASGSGCPGNIENSRLLAITDLRLFVDEVGNSDLNGAAADPNVRYLSLSGILTTRAHHETTITSKLEAAKSCLPLRDASTPIILHRREIVRREGIFATLHDPAIGSSFDNALIDAIKTAPYLAITVQIDKKKHLDTYTVWHYDPYHYCLRCLVERFVLYCRRHRARGLVVIEPRYKKSDKKLKASYELIFKNGTENIPDRIVQEYLLSKDIVFQPKKANIAGLQLADLIAHPSARRMRFLRDGAVEPVDFGSKIADVLTERRYARNPKTLVIDGWGTKWLP